MMGAWTGEKERGAGLQMDGHGLVENGDTAQDPAGSQRDNRVVWAGRLLSREEYLQIPTFLRQGRNPLGARAGMEGGCCPGRG